VQPGPRGHWGERYMAHPTEFKRQRLRGRHEILGALRLGLARPRPASYHPGILSPLITRAALLDARSDALQALKRKPVERRPPTAGPPELSLGQARRITASDIRLAWAHFPGATASAAETTCPARPGRVAVTAASRRQLGLRAHARFRPIVEAGRQGSRRRLPHRSSF
jgi:hypothetical protein